MSHPSFDAGPIAADPPHRTENPLLTQSWLDLAFLHWAVDPADVAPLLPTGTVPDTLDGVSYVGLVAFRMHRVGWFRLPGVPYLGTFPETNVRLYSVDTQGRRGVVFRSLDASRFIPVAVARALFRLPYMWSRMTIRHTDDTITYSSARRWPGPRGAHSRIGIRIRESIEEPTDLEHFLTARWGMHSTFFGRQLYLPNTHPRWPLHRADLVECDESLITAAGLPEPVGDPVSVLYSPGVPVRFGRPARPGGIPTP
ncbi:YqjF family protein [Streptomyces sp. NBC_00467]|uniref:YqjF family protein n=1 Tax=Streptomyces sp. NBC_00467 TaxID=2975752 RepID=UPI003FA773BE